MKTYSLFVRSLLLSSALCVLISPVTDVFASAKRSTSRLVVPQAKLVRDDGESVSFSNEINDGRPVILSFIFTSCTTICPVITNTLAQVQNKLGKERNSVRIVSITIDPEEDTPSRLKAYGEKYHAGSEWHHYTGTIQEIIKIAKAFGVYHGNKMAHTPVIFLRKSQNAPWIRFDGFAKAEEILSEIPEVIAASR
jgi:protein SCO1/2